MTHLRLYRGNTDKQSAYKGYEGEPTYDKGVKTIRIHDGETVGGFPLVKETRQVNTGTYLTGGGHWTKTIL